MTRQKLHSILRRANFEKAKWLKSHRVRGWGHWTEGYEVLEKPEGFQVDHIVGDWKRFKTDEEHDAYYASWLQKYGDALTKAGINLVILNDAIRINNGIKPGEA